MRLTPATIRSIVTATLKAAGVSSIFVLPSCECPVRTGEQVSQVSIDAVRAAGLRTLASSDGTLTVDHCTDCTNATAVQHSSQTLQSCRLLGPTSSLDATSSADLGDTGEEPPESLECRYHIVDSCDGVGRPPLTFRPRPSRSRDPVARYLCTATQLEAASASAFDWLATDLAGLGAPRALVQRARRAACQERRHANILGGLATARGATPAAVSMSRPPARSLKGLAEDNVREGLVVEAWGALVATWQAATATDPAIRRAIAPIARDERAHASLSAAVDSWARAQLTAGERLGLDRLEAGATRAIAAGLTRQLPSAARQALGLPSRREADLLFSGALALA